MAKRFLVLIAALTLATAAFAAGQGERGQPGVFQGDKLVLKGTVSFPGGPHVILKSGDRQYLLMVPPWLVEASGVKEGAQVSVQGYQLAHLPPMMWPAGGTANVVGLYVTQATVDGKDYDLARYYGEMMMGGRGPGNGHGYGPGVMERGYGAGRGMMGDWGDGD